MATQQIEVLLGRMQAVIEQSHALQLKMLEVWRAVLMVAPADEPGPSDDSRPALDFAWSEPDPPDKPTFTVEEVGQILGVSRAAAYRAAQRGEIPTLRVGRRLLVPRTALLSMLTVDRGH
jgi:excisionase family DNA binding protein